MSIALAFIAIALLSACVWARYLVVWSAYSKSGGWPALICAGIAHAAPVYSAILIALAPCSLNRRLLLGIAWFGAVFAALAVGNIDREKIGNVMAFSRDLIYVLPVISLGWLIPLSYLHWFKGWRVELPDSERQFPRERITISTLLLLTLLVSLCFFSAQFASQRYITLSLVGMLVTSFLGLFLAIGLWLVMRAKFSTLAVVIAVIASSFILGQFFLPVFAGTLSGIAPFLAFLVVVVLASLMGCIIMRFSGAKLLTGVPEDAC